MAGYLFNTYTSLNGTAAETLSAYNSLTLIGNKNSLIFDTKRKSIWAKGIEYGYQASNISSDSISTFLPGYTITASGSAGTNVTGGTYTYISGISFTQSKTGNTTAYTLNYTTGTFKIPAGVAPTVTSIDDSNKGSSNATGGTYSYIAAIDIVNSGTTYTLNYSYGKFTIPASSTPTVSSITTITKPAPTTATPLNNTYSYVSGVSITNSNGSYTLRYSYGTFEIPNLPNLSTITTAATNNVTLAWDTHHEFSAALTSSNTVNFTMPAAPTDGRKELMINFVTGATTPTINFPSTVAWENNIPIELVANAPYEVTISYDKVAAKYTAVWGLYGESASSITGGGGGGGSTSLTLSGGAAVSGQYVSGLSLSGNTLSVLRETLPSGGGSGSGSGSGKVYYAYTITGPTTAAKVLICPTYTGASEGDLLFVPMTNRATANATININTQGAAPIYYSDGTTQITGMAMTYAMWFKFTSNKWVMTHSLNFGGTTSISGGGGDAYTFSNLLSSSGNTRIATVTYTGGSVDIYAPTSGGGGTDTWRNVYVNGSSVQGTGTGTGPLRLVAGNDITLTYATGTGITISSYASGGGGGDSSSWALNNTGRTNVTGGAYAYVAGISLNYSGGTYTLSYSYGVFRTEGNTNTWRNVYINGTQWKSNVTTTGYIDFVAGTGVTLSTNGNALTITATGGSGGDTNVYNVSYTSTYTLVAANANSDKTNATTYTTANEAYLNLISDGTSVASAIRLKGNIGSYITARGGTSYISSYKIVPSLSSGTEIATISYPGAGGTAYTATLYAPSGGNVSITGGAAESGKYVSAISASGNAITVTKASLPTVSITSGSAESGKYISAISASGHSITVTKASLPTIPDVSITGGSAETGKYISAISASGHSITVTKETLPSAASISYAFSIANSGGSYTFSLTANGGTTGNAGQVSYNLVSHTSGSGQIYNISVVASPGSDSNTLYIIS